MREIRIWKCWCSDGSVRIVYAESEVDVVRMVEGEYGIIVESCIEVEIERYGDK